MFDVVALGDAELPGEVVAIDGERVTVQAYEDTGGLGPGAPARSRGRPVSALLGPGLLGGVFDGLLRPLDTAGTWLTPGSMRPREDPRRWTFTASVTAGQEVSAGDELGTVDDGGPVLLRVLVPPGCGGPVDRLTGPGVCAAEAVVATVGGLDVPLSQAWPVRRPRPCTERLNAPAVLHTGQRVLDLLYPVALGSSAAVPGGFGTGKTMLLQQIAKWCDADVIVYVGCGERGNEMADVVAELNALTDPRTGDRLVRRTVVIANTSNMPMMAREVSIYTGVTVAEYFRDMGYHVVVIADSTSRWAEALREFASRSGALPAEEGYPAGLASALAAFYERAGQVTTLGGRTRLGHDHRGGLPARRRPHRAGDRPHPAVRPVAVDPGPGPGLRPALPRGGLVGVVLPGRRGARGVASPARATRLWAHRRGRVLALLAEADRLAALAELVGASRDAGVRADGAARRAAAARGRAAAERDSAATTGPAPPPRAPPWWRRCSPSWTGARSWSGPGCPPRCSRRSTSARCCGRREETGPADADAVRRHGQAMLAVLEGLR